MLHLLVTLVLFLSAFSQLYAQFSAMGTPTSLADVATTNVIRAVILILAGLGYIKRKSWGYILTRGVFLAWMLTVAMMVVYLVKLTGFAAYLPWFAARLPSFAGVLAARYLVIFILTIVVGFAVSFWFYRRVSRDDIAEEFPPDESLGGEWNLAGFNLKVLAVALVFLLLPSLEQRLPAKFTEGRREKALNKAIKAVEITPEYKEYEAAEKKKHEDERERSFQLTKLLFSEDHQKLFAWTQYGSAKSELWLCDLSTQKITPLKHQYASAVRVSPRGDFYADNGELHPTDETRAPTRLPAPFKDMWTCGWLSPDEMIRVSFEGEKLYVYNTKTQTISFEFDVPGFKSSAYPSAAFSPSHRYLFLAAKNFLVFDFQTHHSQVIDYPNVYANKTLFSVGETHVVYGGKKSGGIPIKPFLFDLKNGIITPFDFFDNPLLIDGAKNLALFKSTSGYPPSLYFRTMALEPKPMSALVMANEGIGDLSADGVHYVYFSEGKLKVLNLENRQTTNLATVDLSRINSQVYAISPTGSSIAVASDRAVQVFQFADLPNPSKAVIASFNIPKTP